MFIVILLQNVYSGYSFFIGFGVGLSGLIIVAATSKNKGESRNCCD